MVGAFPPPADSEKVVPETNATQSFSPAALKTVKTDHISIIKYSAEIRIESQEQCCSVDAEILAIHF